MTILKQLEEGDIELQRGIFNKISFKVFIISFILHFLTGALICCVLYINTPAHTARGEVSDLVSQLNDSNKTEAIELVDSFVELTYNVELELSKIKSFHTKKSKYQFDINICF